MEVNNNRKSSYTKVVRGKNFPLNQFIALCEDNEGLGLYHFCVRLGDAWQSNCPIFITAQEQLADIKKYCERWLMKHGFPLNSVSIKTVHCEY